MTAVLEPATGTDATEVGLVAPVILTAARRAFLALVDRYRATVLTAVAEADSGFPVASLDKLASPSDFSAADSGRVADALSEAMISLLAEKRIALTVDQKIVSADAP